MKLWRMNVEIIYFSRASISEEMVFFSLDVSNKNIVEKRGERLMYEVSIIYVSQVINFRSLQTIENNK
jgi:hypothetical protein